MLSTVLISVMSSVEFTSEDSPRAPWRDGMGRECLDRTCASHVSCVRRDAIASFLESIDRAVSK